VGDLGVGLANEARLAVLDHFRPAAAGLDHDRHARGHRLKAGARPVLVRLAVDLAVGIERAEKIERPHRAGRKGFRPGGRIADLPADVVRPPHHPVGQFRTIDASDDPPGVRRKFVDRSARKPADPERIAFAAESWSERELRRIESASDKMDLPFLDSVLRKDRPELFDLKSRLAVVGVERTEEGIVAFFLIEQPVHAAGPDYFTAQYPKKGRFLQEHVVAERDDDAAGQAGYLFELLALRAGDDVRLAADRVAFFAPFPRRLAPGRDEMHFETGGPPEFERMPQFRAGPADRTRITEAKQFVHFRGFTVFWSSAN
jgi:hypothetical protein